MKLANNHHHVSSNCWKGFEGQRSKVNVTARPSALLRRMLWRRDHLFCLFSLRPFGE